MINMNKAIFIGIKGAGEMASAIACRLFKSNFKNTFMMETENPMAVRRQVSFCEAIHDGKVVVEGVEAVKVLRTDDFKTAWSKEKIPVIVDQNWISIKSIKPHVVIDAIVAKKNLGTNLNEALLVIGLGPGFEAGKDVHIVIETDRGHNLGRIISKGSAKPNTGIPGNISGFTKERVLRAPCSGIFDSSLSIGSFVIKDDIIGYVDDKPVIAKIDGIIRGQIRNNSRVTDKLKIGDIDPRGKIEYCSTISEKARTISGSVLEAILSKYNR